MRNYKNIDRYLNELLEDVYPQPQDFGHTKLAKEVIDYWMSRMTTCKSCLDVGAGEGFCQPFFESWGIQYEGVALGEDVLRAQEQNRNVKKMDFSFLDYPDNSFDMIFSRHSAEHAPSPLLTFKEWHRVARSWLGIVVPAPEHYGYSGKNHYYVLHMEQWRNILTVAGWRPMWINIKYLKDDPPSSPVEYWILSEKIQ